MGRKKEPLVFLDTHILPTLLNGRTPSKKAQGLIERHQVCISPMVGLELSMLHELGKIKKSAEDIIGRLQSSIGLSVETKALLRAFQMSHDILWTRDIGDRIITAHAMAKNADLITYDENILKHYPLAIH